jgi:hypothetical protein
MGLEFKARNGEQQMSRRTSRALALLSLALSIALAASAATSPRPSKQGDTAPPPKADPTEVRAPVATFDEYRKALGEERQILERQADRQIASVNALFDRATSSFESIVKFGAGVITVAIAVFVYFFGKSSRELVKVIQGRFEALAHKVVDAEADRLRLRYQDLQSQVDELSAYKNAEVVWVMQQGGDRFEEEQIALRSAGVSNLNVVAPAAGEPFSVGTANLCILSFDGTDEGRRILGVIVEQLKTRSPPVPLLIYTFSREAKQTNLDKAELAILSGFLWFIPVNFPAQLLAQTQVLNRRAQAFPEARNGHD